MRDRRYATLLLLGSRLDGLWFPRGALSSPSGLVPARLEPCPACDGVGRLVDRYARETTCAHCAGGGVVAFDPMDSSRARVGAERAPAPPTERTVTCDACAGEGVVRGRRCSRCDGEGRRPLHTFELRLDTRLEGERDPVDASLDARAASGSYAELDRALADLRLANVRAWRSLLTAVDEGETAPLAADLEWPLAYLAGMMPDPIRVPSQVIANGRELERWRKRVKGRAAAQPALAARDSEIRRLLRHDAPVQWVAKEFGLSVAQVYRVARGDPTAVAI